MKFQEMDHELRMKLMEGVEDELSPMVTQVELPTCPKCGSEMAPVKPDVLVGIIPKMDYKCECGVVQKASGIVIT
jgi:hypothetical protein